MNGTGHFLKAADFPQAILDKARHIRLAVFDVDGVLTDGRLYLGSNGEEFKAFHVHDGQGLTMLRENDVQVAVITARSSSVVAERMQALGIEYVFQGRMDKGECLLGLMEKLSLQRKCVCYTGDDLVDLPAMRHAGLKVAVADAQPQIRASADWITCKLGGVGAVREVCDLLLYAQGVDLFAGIEKTL
ncbi:MAG: KdsC family phosphatase [Candidatus Eutrophobiaceae bacterium]